MYREVKGKMTISCVSAADVFIPKPSHKGDQPGYKTYCQYGLMFVVDVDIGHRSLSRLFPFLMMGPREPVIQLA